MAIWPVTQVTFTLLASEILILIRGLPAKVTTLPVAGHHWVSPGMIAIQHSADVHQGLESGRVAA
jgi:hypothetical protein